MKSRRWPNKASDSQSLWNRRDVAQVNLRGCLKGQGTNVFHNASNVSQGKTQNCRKHRSAEMQRKSFMYTTFDMSGSAKKKHAHYNRLLTVFWHRVVHTSDFFCSTLSPSTDNKSVSFAQTSNSATVSICIVFNVRSQWHLLPSSSAIQCFWMWYHLAH